MVTSNNLLTEPLWSGHGGDSVQGFKFHGCWWERKIAGNRYDGPAAVKVGDVTRRARQLASVCTTKINNTQPGSHCQMQYKETRPAPQWCDCTRQWTHELLNLSWPAVRSMKRTVGLIRWNSRYSTSEKFNSWEWEKNSRLVSIETC